MVRFDYEDLTLPAKSTATALIMFVTLCLSANGTSVEMPCESDALWAFEIEACVSDKANCDAIGTLRGRVQIRDFLSLKLQAGDDEFAFNEVALVRFEVREPKSVRFFSNGFKNKSLFRIDNDGGRLVSPCLVEEIVKLTPGTYILKSIVEIGSIDNLSEGELSTTIETVTNMASMESKGSEQSGEKSNRHLEFRRTMGWAALFGSVGILIVILVGFVL